MKFFKEIFISCLLCMATVTLQAQSVNEKDKNVTDEKTVIDKDEKLVKQLRLKKLRLIVYRHGEATNNVVQQVVSSRSPGISLTRYGKEQTHACAEQIRNGLDCQVVIYSSPLFRSQQSANILGHDLDIPYQNIWVDDRLKLQTFGVFEGMDYEKYKSFFDSPEEMFYQIVPGHEYGLQVFDRLQSLLWSISKTHYDKTIIIVTHAFNCCYINKCLVGQYDYVPELGEFRIYDFTQ